MNQWSLNRKIWSIVGLLAVAFIASVIVGQFSLMQAQESLAEIGNLHLKRLLLADEIRDGQRRMLLSTFEITTLKEKKAIEDEVTKFGKIYDEQQERIKNLLSVSSEVGKKAMNEYQAAQEGVLAVIRNAQDHLRAGETEKAEAAVMSADFSALRKKMLLSVDEIAKFNKDNIFEAVEDGEKQAKRAIIMSLAISVTSILTCLLTAYFVLRSLSRAIAEVVRNLADSSVHVSTAANQIATSSESLSQSTTEQAASLEETAASIEEMNSMIAKNSEASKSTAEKSNLSHQKATEGKNVVEKMIHSMTAIDKSNSTIIAQVNTSNENMVNIIKVIEEIGTKTKVINDIVFQTKLLSFNASVEAARAGEHGKGFAVVAEEVGAQMSGNAAKEISALLDQSVSTVNKIVDESKSKIESLVVEGKTTVDQGIRVASQCGEVLNDIVHNVQQATNMAGEIASASQEQSRGCAEITKAMTQLDQMTQQNASTSEECASAAEELSSQAESLRSLVAKLVLTVNGSNSDTASFAGQIDPVSTRAPKLETASARPKMAKNVISIKKTKNSKEMSAHSGHVVMRTASSEMPQYENQGFEEV